MNTPIHIADEDLLLLVDLQNDFCPSGALAVPQGETVIPVANRLACMFRHIVLTQDWHPKGHLSFASSHAGTKPYDKIAVSYGMQELWPDHCVQGSRGAEFHRDAMIPQAELILRKGYHPQIDSYSAFRENDRVTRTGLAGYLRERGIRRVFLAGLALDFCVRYSAEDALEDGFTPIVIEDACAAIDIGGSLAATWTSFEQHGISVVRTGALG